MMAGGEPELFARLGLMPTLSSIHNKPTHACTKVPLFYRSSKWHNGSPLIASHIHTPSIISVLNVVRQLATLIIFEWLCLIIMSNFKDIIIIMFYTGACTVRPFIFLHVQTHQK